MKYSFVVVILIGLFSATVFGQADQDQKAATENTSKTIQKKAQDPQKDSAQSEDKGFGPVKELKLGPIDPKLAAEGKRVFNSTCTSCHSMNNKVVGPPLGDVVNQRTPEFIMNMIINTSEMEQKDENVKKMISQYHIPMPSLGISEEQARAILEYLREYASQEKTK